MIKEILLAYTCGLMDRFRGDVVDVLYSKTIEAIIYGLIVAAIIGFGWVQVLIFSLLWATGAAFGWGTPLGSYLTDKEMDQNKLESWQFGIFKTNTVLACALRGFIWGICVAPLAYFNLHVLFFIPAMTVIFPLAIYISKKVQIINIDKWAQQEFLRGWMVGITALIIKLL